MDEIIRNISLFIFSIAIIAIGILGFLVFLNNRKSVTNKSFFLFSLITLIWSALNYLSFQFNSENVTLFILRLVIFFGVWHSFSVFLLFYVFPNEKINISKKIKFILFPILIIVSALVLTPLVFRGIEEMSPTGGALRVINGPAMPIFGITVLGLIISGFTIFIKKMRIIENELENKRFKLIFIGALSFFLFLLAFNFILPAFFNISFFIKLSAVFVFPFIGFTAYAIYKHQLFNVKVIATELLVFAIWIIILIELLFAENVRERILSAAILFFIIVAGILLIRSVKKEVQQRERLETITKELEEANEKLKKLDDLKTDFISIASHQLRTPLTAIKGYTSMIMEGSYGEVSDKVRETIGKVFQSAQRLIYIVNDLLDISRIEQGRFTIALEPIKVANALKDVVEELQQNAKTKNLSLELAVAPENMEVMASADFNKIRQVFSNVIDNAIKYTNEGYVKIGVERRAKDVLVSVKDSGLGISEASMKNLFQKFSRAKGVTKLHTDGSGLGLFIVKKIMEAHGGDVWAESEGESKGSQFYVSIPVSH